MALALGLLCLCVTEQGIALAQLTRILEESGTQTATGAAVEGVNALYNLFWLCCPCICAVCWTTWCWYNGLCCFRKCGHKSAKQNRRKWKRKVYTNYKTSSDSSDKKKKKKKKGGDSS